MTNNIKNLRIAFLLSPKEFARLIGIYPEYIARLESADGPITELWITAVSKGLGVPRSAVSDPRLDASAVAKSVGRPPSRPPIVCPIGARFAILSLVAKWGGLSIANDLDEDEVADAVQSLIAYVDDRTPNMPGKSSGENRASRLSRGLQITALTILQSRSVDLPPDFEQSMQAVLPAATSLLEAFSAVDETAWLPEK